MPVIPAADTVQPTAEHPRYFPGDITSVCFCIGAAKAGTTWLFEQLVRHPDVHGERPSDRPKELHYWNTLRSPFAQRFKARATEWRRRTERFRGLLRLRELYDSHARAHRARTVDYEAIFLGDPYDHRRYAEYMMRSRRGERVLLDSTPQYALLHADVYAEMLAMHSDVRFIFIMRDPLKRLWSGVRHRHRTLIQKGIMGEASVQKAFVSAIRDPDHFDFRFSAYDRTIAQLERFVPGDRILYLFYETLFEPESVDSIYDFLGLARMPARAGEKINEAEGPVFRLPSALAAEGRRALEPVYQALTQRFGNALPAAWQAAVS